MLPAGADGAGGPPSSSSPGYGTTSRSTRGEVCLLNQQWSGRGWSVLFDGQTLAIDDKGRAVSLPAHDALTVTANRSWFRWELRREGKRLLRLPGVRGRDARAMALAPEIWSGVAWAGAMTTVVGEAVSDQRWIPREAVDELLKTRPEGDLGARVKRAGLEPVLTADESASLKALDIDLVAFVAQANEGIAEAEVRTQGAFFASIERQPLTDEQARAVICFDNRVQVIAAAGSGKTSVMVGRAGYAVARKFVAPERILLLAFNKVAAAELQERLVERLRAAGIDSTGLHASTFHSFGLGVIGRATGAKPRLAPWLDAGGDAKMIARIVEELRDSSPGFRLKWDQFRLLYAKVATKAVDGDPDTDDRKSRPTVFRTFDGQEVKSHGERLIADWLYLNGVPYKYEEPYPGVTADANHGEYRPDFYYPNADLWHEHWATDRNGETAEGKGWDCLLYTSDAADE